MARKKATTATSKKTSKAAKGCDTKTCRCHLTYTEQLSIFMGMVGAVGATIALWAMSLNIT